MDVKKNKRLEILASIFAITFAIIAVIADFLLFSKKVSGNTVGVLTSISTIFAALSIFYLFKIRKPKPNKKLTAKAMSLMVFSIIFVIAIGCFVGYTLHS